MVAEGSKLYSWVDVKNELLRIRESNSWPENIKVEIYGSGLYVYYTKDHSESTALEWLKKVFPAAINGEIKGIRLENINGKARYLPIFAEVVEEIIDEHFSPGFSASPELSAKVQKPTIELQQQNNPVIIAAHSFKGGVGRTLHALALAASIEKAEPEAKILFVDADFEAPGTTWLTPDAEISLADVLHLVHGSETPLETVPFLKDSLLNQQNGNIYFLPAFRTERQMTNLEIKPEHIFKFSDNPFILTDVFAELSRQLNADYLIIDLRAGISELSANWLLDPRVLKLLVTTLNSQSVEGTSIVLKLLSERQLRHGVQVAPPVLVVSQVTRDSLFSLQRIWEKSEEPSSLTAAQNIHLLRDIYESYLAEISNLDTYGEDKTVSIDELPFILSPHFESLLVLSNNWDNLKRV